MLQTCCNGEVGVSGPDASGLNGGLNVFLSVLALRYTLALTCIYLIPSLCGGGLQTLISWGKSSLANMSSQELSEHRGDDMLLKGDGDLSYPESL